jgi:hypothetical protein
MLDRAWTTTSLLNESKVDYVLVEGHRSEYKVCDSMNICIGVSIWLAGLTVHVEGLVNSGEQQMTN